MFTEIAPLVSAVPWPTLAPLNVTWTVSPARKPEAATVTALPAAPCGGVRVRPGPGCVMVKVAVAERPLESPLAVTPNWPGARFGTVNGSLNWPLVFAVGVPTALPLNETLTVSPAWNPEPLITIAVPAAALLGARDRLAAGVPVVAGVVVAGVVAGVVVV